MFKVLRVGDPHAKINNLEEMSKLMDFVLETARLHKVSQIEILGDLFHTHAVLRLEVQEFWAKYIGLLSHHFPTIILVGNHDLSGNYNSSFSSQHVWTFKQFFFDHSRKATFGWHFWLFTIHSRPQSFY